MENLKTGDKIKITWVTNDANRVFSFQKGDIAEIIDIDKDGEYYALFENNEEACIGKIDEKDLYCKFEKVESEINWKDYEDKEIEVSFDGKSWYKKILEKYNPEKENLFICEKEYNNNKYFSWPYARLIEKKELEIDWSNVPEGTQVSCVGDSISCFMAYLPNHEYKYWVYDSYVKKDVAVGYKNCKLAEPVKPEWIKKD